MRMRSVPRMAHDKTSIALNESRVRIWKIAVIHPAYQRTHASGAMRSGPSVVVRGRAAAVPSRSSPIGATP